MKVGDLVKPRSSLEGWDWIGLVIAMLIDDGEEIAVVNWNRDRFEAEHEYCSHLVVVNESR